MCSLTKIFVVLYTGPHTVQLRINLVEIKEEKKLTDNNQPN